MIGPKHQEEFDLIYKRAHTFDGYAHVGGATERAFDHMVKVRSDWVANRVENYPLEDLRAALFIEARGIHFDGYPPSLRLFYYLRDLDRMIAEQISIPLDQAVEYRSRDLSAEGIWPAATQALRYGSVIFDGLGRVLLRHPAGDFDGYAWTFAKGRPIEHENSLDAALRITQGETGIGAWNLDVIGNLPSAFGGTGTGSSNCFYLMRCVSTSPSQPLGAHTTEVHWFSAAGAQDAIARSTNESGRKRDLRILATALESYQRMTAPVATSK